ncbi:MAG: hypothetical protein MJE68_06590, partial [Proteobacteria bacterium]|nr:hypothetical protein [Pseudomonadota bacterium]
WIPITTPTLEPPKRSQPLIYYPPNNSLIMFGGYDGSIDVNDTWEYNGVDWQQINTTNAVVPMVTCDKVSVPIRECAYYHLILEG